MGHGVNALGLRPVASRLRVRGYFRAVGSRALRSPIRVHQLFGPRRQVDAFEVEIEELLVAVPRSAREGLVPG